MTTLDKWWWFYSSTMVAMKWELWKRREYGMSMMRICLCIYYLQGPVLSRVRE
jgi:hypothetical protein